MRKASTKPAKLKAQRMKSKAASKTSKRTASSDDDFDSEDEGSHVVLQVKKKPLDRRFEPEESEGSEDEDDEEGYDSHGEDAPNQAKTDTGALVDGEGDDELDGGVENSEDFPGDLEEDTSHLEISSRPLDRLKLLQKIKSLTEEQLLKEQKRIKKTGVCYLSRIPPYMKPAKLRSILIRFGEVDRLFLKPEDTSIHQKRVKYGGNKKKNYTEGWVEFKNKRDAKLCEATLNGNNIGGKKSSYYYDDVMNIKYLSGFKWMDLTQQIAKENEMRQAKLSMEISQQQKLNKSFISNVEKSKMIENIQQKRKAKQDAAATPAAASGEELEMRRHFKQRKITSARADADDKLKERARPNDKLNDVLLRVF